MQNFSFYNIIFHEFENRGLRYEEYKKYVYMICCATAQNSLKIRNDNNIHCEPLCDLLL